LTPSVGRRGRSRDVGRDHLDRAWHGDRRVVDEHVDLAGTLDRSGDRGGVGDVERELLGGLQPSSVHVPRRREHVVLPSVKLGGKRPPRAA
jgi:hypothetical protein